MRRWALAVGGLALAGAVVVGVTGITAPVAPVVVLVGGALAAAAVGLLGLLDRAGGGPTSRALAETGGRVPGREFDERLARAAGDGGREREVRERIERLAVETLVAERGLSVETARERIRAGTWTDDPLAAAFLGADVTVERTLRERLAALAGGESRLRRGARRAVAAIEEVGG